MKPCAETAATESAQQGRSKLLLAVLMIPAVYPFITALLYVISPLTEGWEIWQRTLLLTPVMVFLIAYVVAPFVRARFGWCIAVAHTPRNSR